MCKFSSKSGGVPFQISFFWGDLTRNDPNFIREAGLTFFREGVDIFWEGLRFFWEGLRFFWEGLRFFREGLRFFQKE